MFDPTNSIIDYINFQECNWADVYEGAVEVIPPYGTLCIDKDMDLCMVADSNHADKKQSISKIGFMLYRACR